MAKAPKGMRWFEKPCPKTLCGGVMVQGGTIGQSWWRCRKCGHTEPRP